MTDVFDPAKRSEVMSKIRSKNTKAEVITFSYLRKQKVYFQRHYKRAPGSPDIALPRKKIAVFIDGDFWHGKTLDQLIARRGADDTYWVPKIMKNMERDRQQEKALLEAGWRILRIWEADILRKRTREQTLHNILFFLKEEV
jgi:DNA mismatch endonuclease (patch repair protein)